MNSEHAATDKSPSTSTFDLLSKIHSRRGSIGSSAGASQLDRDTLAQSLDQINQYASRSDTLTTFNEYTSPPSSSQGGEAKGLAGDLQGGLSGFYRKVKASVGNVRDIVTQAGEHGAFDETPLQSPKLAAPTPAPSSLARAKPYSFLGPNDSAVSLSHTQDAVHSPDPSTKESTEASKGANPGRSAKPNLVLGATTAPNKGSLTPNLPLKSPLAPLALPTTVVSPAIAEASGTDNRDDQKSQHAISTGKGGLSSRAEEQLHETVNKQKTSASHADTPTAPEARKEEYAQTIVDHTMEAAQRMKEPPSSQGVDGQRFESSKTQDLDYFTATKPPLEPPRIVTHAGTPQKESSRTSHGTRPAKEELFDSSVTDSLNKAPARGTDPITPDMTPPVSVQRQQSSDLRRSDTSSLGPTYPYPRMPSSKEQNFVNISQSTLSQTRNRVLDKEYWMKDENARDCFYCGDPFSTFRRKHHCRTCGQIFDAKCTSILPGAQFGHPGSIRVCKPCEGIIDGYDDSSEFSNDSSIPAPSLRPRHGSAGASDALGSPGPRSRTGSFRGSRQSPKHSDLAAPTMSIPATRMSKGDASQKPSIVEIEAERTLLRPSSSRSLKSVHLSRPFTPGHRRHNSRHLHHRGTRTLFEDSAPFHGNVAEEKRQRLPAFHDDNIIDPDLAPYLSDDASSGDEQIGIAAAINGEGISRSFDEKTTLAGYLGPSKKSRSRAGDKNLSGVTFASRDTDNISIHSSRTPNARSSRRRNLNTVGNLHRPSPRAHRMSAAIPVSNTNLHESFSTSALAQMMSASSSPAMGPRMIRSSSMRGAAAPAVELNSASLQHVRRLLRQLLQDSHIPSVGSWEKALIPILLQATDDVNPDVQNGDDIDIRHYVKLKKIPGGKPDDTLYVSGLVFSKNLALKSMPRNIPHPSILILTFPLEYARHQQHFMSLEPVIRQEREFLQNLVNRIAALQPNLLLVERSVSGLALEFLEKANIATAYNVKASVLEAVSRCSQTRIISSIDKLAIKAPQPGKCSSFYLKTYVRDGRRKTYMFISGCAKELGCTVVLRGASDTILAKMKRITEFMIYVVYNLKLETCLMRDEFALIPSAAHSGVLSPGSDTAREAARAVAALPGDATSISSHKLNVDAEKTSADVSNAEVLQSSISKPTFPESKIPDDSVDMNVPEDIPMPTFYSDMVEEHRTKILSASPFVRFTQPYLLMRAREQERRLAYLRRLRDLDISEAEKLDGKSESQTFELIRPEMVHETVRAASKSVREVLHAVHDAEYDKALHNYQVQSKQWETYISGNINLFDPRAHQNIAVLYSVVCTVTTTPCSGPDLLALGFYNEHETNEDFEADCTLGQYVEDLCFGANTICTANGCERKMFDHHRQYVHGEAQISVFVERYPCKLRGLQDTILMWSCCRLCGKETQVMPMSESTWKYSFGKYLELSFWSKDVHARADVCPHDLHRDHLRYFGFKELALRVHYDPIALLEVIVPRTRITWKVDNDLRFKNDLYTKIEERINKFMLSVKARIKSIMVESVVPEKMENCRQEVSKLTERSREEHRVLVRHLQEKYMTSKHYETVPFNQAIRATQEKVAEWDKIFADFDDNFFPSEKDIRRLATLQLKRIFLEKDDSNASLNSTDSANSNDEGGAPIVPANLKVTPGSSDEPPSLSPQTRNMSPEKAHDMLTSVVDNHTSPTNAPDAPDNPGVLTSQPATTASNLPTQDGTTTSSENVAQADFRHLDLAISPEQRQQSSESEALANGEPRAIDFAAKFSDPNYGQTARRKSDGRDDQGLETDNGGHARPPATIQPLLQHEPARLRLNQISGIPRPMEGNRQQPGVFVSPPLHRAHSQPVPHQRELSNGNKQRILTLPESRVVSNGTDKPVNSNPEPVKPADKKLTDRLGLGTIKTSGITAHSMIPRSIAPRKDSHVSSLAKHFERLSREFEKERLRERRQRFSKSRQSRAYPMAAAKPIVEVYNNVREAVEERDPSDEDVLAAPPPMEAGEPPATVDQMAQMEDSQTSVEMRTEDTTAENTETEENTLDSHVGSDTEGEAVRNETDQPSIEDVLVNAESHHALSPTEAQLDLKLDLPKHEKNSLMKMLTNFWAERSASGWKALDYPLNIYDHIFADSDIIVREDEPSSLIAFALGSEDYKAKLGDITSSTAAANPDGGEQAEIQRTMNRTTGTHLKYQFQEGSAKMLCKVFYAEQFDAVRRKCGVSERMVESLSRCLKWDSKGGKTKSVFLKTLDDRFVLKSLPPGETQTFLRFAPAYFRLMSECLFHDLPSVIAKMLGFYQIVIKNPLTGVDFNWYLIVMENLFYARCPTRIFDLKGSMRNRRIQSTGEQNEVLLDENMVEFIYESPLFSREHSKKLLRASVWNDTLFLSRQNVMDYSLMIAIDENRKELVVGIIDCIRTYTWDKKLEFWFKDRGGRTRPTVTSPARLQESIPGGDGPVCFAGAELLASVPHGEVGDEGVED
ncbi:Mitochondrial distribution and morphology protein 12 [Xanthoria parietina]